ncbi:MAG TPA: hypothetical protein PKC60_01705 [Hydrogenophaga sp.]|uniref:hypothetical protein n=1 Tax=Hydrogenophaga sp. TaxID=1904254 RepID=UPI002B8292A4|nr:hypothetical protein [Hydrogenophaga sp.]HMN91920.1 hypothetical protein [Hydrogenophaga sp.]HMP08940.1 hypothetical protein [Hydrogenophaga sp.]
MKPVSYILISTLAATLGTGSSWAEAETPALVQGGSVLLLPVEADPHAHAGHAPSVRLRDSLSAWEHKDFEKAQVYPYRLSVDERKRMREQLRSQAPSYRIPHP